MRQRQLELTLCHLIRAMTVSHTRVRRLAALRIGISITLAAIGLMTVFAGSVNSTPFIRSLSITVTVAGALWALIYSMGLASWAHRELLRAALLQETFEVRLFHLTWNHALAGDEVPTEDVHKLSGRFRGPEDSLRVSYEMPNLPAPFDVLVRQQQNLAWGGRVRHRYARIVLSGILTWAAIGLLTAMVRGSTVTDFIVQWCVPSLGMLMLGWDTFREQRGIFTERRRVARWARARCLQSAALGQDPVIQQDLWLMARQVQDQLFLSRRRAPRVPTWFFHRYYTQDSSDFTAGLAEMRRSLLAAGLQSRPPRTRT
ncbi:S-4TM family putative pore-forming effector [Actinoplanes sp. NEAU-A12]|uniref:S-4TM family putative pore-forming effector n=2 Tax=Actinoplanes sandaracinus TaxID=3045177 RepID=A0ABT6WMG4_9ACTN|nr:S-4TM family putative pore-forming effector [Actinoplanes sandaracinus]